MPSPTPCWYCRHFKSIDTSSLIVACGLVGCMLHSRDGCSRYEREPGVDDDHWEPRLGEIAAYRPDAARVSRSRGTDGWWTEPPRPRRPPAPPPAPVAQPNVFWMFEMDEE